MKGDTKSLDCRSHVRGFTAQRGRGSFRVQGLSKSRRLFQEESRYAKWVKSVDRGL